MQIRFREGRVEQAEIGTHIIGSQHLANNAVSYAAQIKDGIIGYAELTTGLQGSLGVPGPDSIGTTELKEPSVGSSQLYAPAVGSQNIYSQAVYAAKIKNNTVGSQQLANSGVISTKIAKNAVGSQQLANGGVIASKIANDAVGSQHIANDAIGSSAMIGAGVIRGYNIESKQIDTIQLADDSVNSLKIADYAVTEPKFARHFEVGRMGTVTLTLRYYTFTTAFSAVPTVIICGQGILTNAGIQLAQTPNPGSFRVGKNVGAGTVKGYYMAWGSR